MPLNLGTRRTLLGAGATYADKVMALGPIAYWPLWEASGSVAYDISGNGLNGTHVSTVLGQPGIGDGRSSTWFDGSNDYINIYSAGLNTAFDGDEGSLMIWFKINAAGVWADGDTRRSLYIAADAANRLIIQKEANLNQIYRFGTADNEAVTHNTTSVVWICYVLTWSDTAGATGEVKLYTDGTQEGSTATDTDTWVGALSSTETVLGAASTTPGTSHSGWLAHAALWDSALAQSAVTALAVV